MNRSRAFFAILAGTLCAAMSPLTAKEEDPYFFADETIDESERDRQARTLKTGPKIYGRGSDADTVPAYRKKRSPLDELIYLEPGDYEAKVIGILCNACTDAVVAHLKEFKEIPSAAFDFEEGVLRFKVVKLEKKSKHPMRFIKVRRAIERAGRRIRLDTHFTISEIKKVQ